MIQLNEPIARFTGIQPGFDDIKPYELWTLNRAISNHPAGSTLCRETIEEHGFRLPPAPRSPFHTDPRVKSMELGTVLSDLPSRHWGPHMVVVIEKAYLYGYANRLWSKLDAMRLLFLSNMEFRESYGHGNKAARRLKAERAGRLGLSLADYAAYERDQDELAREQAKADTLRDFERRERAQVPQEAPL